MSRVMQFKTCMVVSQLLSINNCPNVLHVRPRLKRLGNNGDTREFMARVFEGQHNSLKHWSSIGSLRLTSLLDLATSSMSEI